MFFSVLCEQGSCHMALRSITCLLNGWRHSRTEKIAIFSLWTPRAGPAKLTCWMHEWINWQNEIWGVLKMSPVCQFYIGQALHSKKAAGNCMFGTEVSWTETIFVSFAPYQLCHLWWGQPLSQKGWVAFSCKLREENRSPEKKSLGKMR